MISSSARAWPGFGIIATCFMALAGCGGGGGGNGGTNTPPPTTGFTTPTAEDLANASNAQLTTTLREDNRQLTITWVDTFPGETNFKVEARTDGGVWETLETLVATAATGTTHRWQRVVDTARTYRVSATVSTYAVPLKNAGGQSEILIDPSTLPMLIALDQENPLRGIVQIRIANPKNVQWVDWYIDTVFYDSVDTIVGYPTGWNVASVLDGPHLITASVRLTSGTRVELTREVIVDNPPVALVFSARREGESGANLRLRARAVADAGIQSVQFLANDNPLQVVTTPTTPYNYELLLDAATLATLPSGINHFKAIATDNNLETAEVTIEVENDHRPLLSLVTPYDGAIVSGQLHVQGNFTDDTPGARLTLSLGDTYILRDSTASTIDFTFPTNSLPGGEYTFVASVSDGKGAPTERQFNIIVNSSPRTFQLVAKEAEVLATHQGAVLYRKSDGTVIWRNAGGAETTLQTAGLSNVGVAYGQLEGTHAVLSALAGPGQSALYHFSPSGQGTNITQPLGVSNFEGVLLRSPWVVWTNNDGARRYSLYNLETDAHITVPVPSTATTGANFRYDFIPMPGAEQFFFWARTGGTNAASIWDIFRYRLDADVTDLLTGGDSRQVYVQTDGVRVAWQKSPSSAGSNSPLELIVAPVANPTSSTSLSTTMAGEFALKDGTLAWLEGSINPRVLKVDDGTVTTVSSNASYASSWNAPITADGHVIFTENGKTYSWSRTAGKQLLLDVLPSRPIQMDDGIVFITTGATGRSIHRVVLP